MTHRERCWPGPAAGPRERAELQDLLRAAVLCNDAHLERRDGRWRCVGDPTEGRCWSWRPRAA